MEKELLKWLVIHLRYTQALCEIILENMPEKSKEELIRKVRERLKDIDTPPL